MTNFSNEILPTVDIGVSTEKHLDTIQRQTKMHADSVNIGAQDEVKNETSLTMADYLEKNGVAGKVTEVSLFQVEQITREPSEISQILTTEKLNGCTAIAIWSQDSAQLSHFPPFMLEKHLNAISTCLNTQDRRTAKNYAFIYLSSKRRENEFKIIAFLKKNLGNDCHITVNYYEQKSDQDSQYIALEFKSNSNVVAYHGKTMTQFIS